MFVQKKATNMSHQSLFRLTENTIFDQPCFKSFNNSVKKQPQLVSLPDNDCAVVRPNDNDSRGIVLSVSPTDVNVAPGPGNGESGSQFVVLEVGVALDRLQGRVVHIAVQPGQVTGNLRIRTSRVPA